MNVFVIFLTSLVPVASATQSPSTIRCHRFRFFLTLLFPYFIIFFTQVVCGRSLLFCPVGFASRNFFVFFFYILPFSLCSFCFLTRGFSFNVSLIFFSFFLGLFLFFLPFFSGTYFRYCDFSFYRLYHWSAMCTVCKNK